MVEIERIVHNYQAIVDSVGANLISENVDIERHPDLTFGETPPWVAVEIIGQMLRPKDDIFIDLTAGWGGPVIVAALFNHFSRAIGIEIVPTRFEIAMQHASWYKYYQNYWDIQTEVEFTNADFLKVPLENADVLYLSATTFPPKIYQSAVKKIHSLKRGARIAIVDRQIRSASFKHLQHKIYPMSYGVGLVYFYQRR